MATSNIKFDVGLRNPNFQRYSSGSELSSDYSDDELKKTPKAQETTPDENLLPQDLSHISRPSSSMSLRSNRDSSVSGVSSQVPRSSSSKKKQQKRKKKKSSVGNPSDIDPAKIGKELACVSFPLENYDFRLVCSACLIKQREGPNGYILKTSCDSCLMDQLAIKKKSASNWIKVRERPKCGDEFSGFYRICYDFNASVICKVNPCTFAHGEGEQFIWSFELQKKFMLNTFIKKLQKCKIVTNEMLEKVKSKNKYIPGLTSEESPSSPLPASNKESAIKESTSKGITSNHAPLPMPSKNGYTKISLIEKKDGVLSSTETVPVNNITNFPKLNLNDNYQPVDSTKRKTYSQLASVPRKPIPFINPALKPINVESWPLAKDENPLKKTHNFRMFCSSCFSPSSKRDSCHNCLKNILAFTEKGSTHWLQVRERKKVRSFSGNYILCDSANSTISQCRYGNNNCTFAHNTIEQILWIADKQEKFDLTEFILSHSSVKLKISDFVKRHGNSFSFICHSCFTSSDRVISQREKNHKFCNGLAAHDWNTCKILFYEPERIIINKKPYTTHEYYKQCYNVYCKQRNCPFTHSLIERDVWMLFRETKITEDMFINYIESPLTTKDSAETSLVPCPFKIDAFCSICYLNGQKKKHSQCGHSELTSGFVFLTSPEQKQINQLPPKIPKNYHFQICRSMKNKKCNFKGKCTFAHSEEEIKIWKWMCYNDIKNVNDLLRYQEKQPKRIVAGSSSIFQNPTPAVNELPEPHYCQFCNVSCINNIEWENHCAMPEHNVNITCSQEQQWNYREPAWNFINEKDLRLCETHKKGGACIYSNSLDMYNLCPCAHRIEELEEWKKRFEWRELKADMAKNPALKSYISELQSKYFDASNPTLLMKENIPDIQLTADKKKKVSSVKKEFQHTWTFKVTSTKHKLKKVALLHDRDRLYFKVSPLKKNQSLQVLDGSKCKLKENQWELTACFEGNMYGSFKQRVIFDFGTEPWLFWDLSVEVGTSYNLKRLKTIREKNNLELWTPENREVILLCKPNDLLQKYKKPFNVDDIMTQDAITKKLNRHNYVQKMHKLLYLEEFECQQKISRYNLCAEMSVLEIIQEDSTMVKSNPGTLFGCVHLSDELSEDTDIGKLVLTSCSSVYIGLPASKKKVYEVNILKQANSDLKGYYRDKVYLTLEQSCIQDLHLKPNSVIKVEIQFQLDRLSFCFMHYAVDNLVSIDLVFPDPVKNLLSQKSKPIKCRSGILNEEQLIAVKYILGQRGHYMCPFILNGSYGTGKTETLAQATMELLDTQPNCKILICTQCNSSADLFIQKHLDKYMVKNNQEKSLLRIVYSGRNIRTIPKEAQKYTLFSEDRRHFRQPETKDFQHIRVVIGTLENTYELIKLNMKGFFTHIFIDEAAQEFECKVLLPLALATKETYIVLSGDHHQMGITIHSTEARRQGLGTSIMQRIFEHYASYPYQELISEYPVHTQLIHTYRSVKEISSFISTCFYGVGNNLRPENALHAVHGLKPLQLYVTFGVATYSANSTSYYNVAEVNQIIDCVNNISKNWPTDLEPFQPEDICIVTAYRDQVVLIRSYLRSYVHQQKGYFSRIVVEHVGNIPGKEFKVIIISTVRTQNCLNIRRDIFADYCDETDESDFFFNKKLLNTAMTRAKYSVITVGDPVALCAYGKCSTIWRIFLNYCSKLCSVNPSSVTYSMVRHEVNMLLYNQKQISTQQTEMDKSSLQHEQSNYQPEFPQAPSNRTVPIPIATTHNQSDNVLLKYQPEFPQVPSNRTVPIPIATTHNQSDNVLLKYQPEFPQASSNRTVPIPIATTHNQSDNVLLKYQPEFPQAPSNRTVPIPIATTHDQLANEPLKYQPEFPQVASNLTITTPFDTNGPQPVKDSHSGAIPSSIPTRPEILKLDLHQASPLDYPKSKMDSLFSASKDTSGVRLNFTFPSVYAFDSPTENLIIGISVYKVEQNFIVGVHWPDLQSYMTEKNFNDLSISEMVLALYPKQQLPIVPEKYFTLEHTIGATSCLMKVDEQGNLLDCSFHETLIKPQQIISIEKSERYLQNSYKKKELNFLNYLQELTSRWCQLRVGNEHLYLKDLLIGYPQSRRLLNELYIHVHVQIVRFLSNVFPETTPTAWLSIKEGPELELWKKEHVSDALNSVLLLQPYLQGTICQCKFFCKCLLDYIIKKDMKSDIPQTLVVNLNTWQYIVRLVNEDKYEEAQDVILNPCYHFRLAVALKKISNLTCLEIKCSGNNNATYEVSFDPQIYFCKPSVSLLDLFVQRMLVAAVHKKPNPVTVKEMQEITKKLPETIETKRMLQKDFFFEILKNDSSDQTIEAQATIISVTDSVIEILFPQLVSWSYFIELDMLGSRSALPDVCSLEFSQIDVNALTYSRTPHSQGPGKCDKKKIESNQFTICIKANHWQQILSSLRCQDFCNLKNYIQIANSAAVLNKELDLLNHHINAEVNYTLEVYPYFNLQASVRILKDQDEHYRPQVQLLHLTPNVSLCLLHREKPLRCFFPSPLNLCKDQQRLLTEVYCLTLRQHHSVIIRDVTLLQEDKFWTFEVPLVFLQNHEISLMPDIRSEDNFVYPPMQNIICVRFSFMLSKNVKSTPIFHGYICNTKCSESNVKVFACITDDTHSHLQKLQKRHCSLEIICWKPIHRSMADSILNLTKANPLAKKIVNRQLDPVKTLATVSLVIEQNEFVVIESENSNYSLSYLLHWFEDYASLLHIQKLAQKSPILICTSSEDELNIIVDVLLTRDLLSKFNIVRVADVSDEKLPSFTSQNKIFLHEKYFLENQQFMEEMNAMKEIYGNDFHCPVYSDPLSKADIILCTCSTSCRSVIRSVSSIKQMIIFNAHLCSEVLAMIPISYYNLEKLSLFCSPESSTETSIVYKVIQSCPQTKVQFK